MTYLKPELGKTYEIALRYPKPRNVKGFSGDDEHLWFLTDGRGLFAPIEFASQITDLGLKAGQRFSLIRSRQNGRIEWKAERLAQPAAALVEQQGALDMAYSQPDREPSRLEFALAAAVTAAHEAEKEGETIGYPCRFSSADIRAMAISVLIGMDRRAA
jgi:hypothetical protein